MALAPHAPGRHRGGMSEDSVFAPRYRALSIGALLSITIVAFQALGVGTAMPAIARDLGGLSLYGWSLSAFMLASILGTVAAGRAADATGPTDRTSPRSRCSRRAACWTPWPGRGPCCSSGARCRGSESAR